MTTTNKIVPTLLPPPPLPLAHNITNTYQVNLGLILHHNATRRPSARLNKKININKPNAEGEGVCVPFRHNRPPQINHTQRPSPRRHNDQSTMVTLLLYKVLDHTAKNVPHKFQRLRLQKTWGKSFKNGFVNSSHQVIKSTTEWHFCQKELIRHMCATSNQPSS